MNSPNFSLSLSLSTISHVFHLPFYIIWVCNRGSLPALSETTVTTIILGRPLTFECTPLSIYPKCDCLSPSLQTCVLQSLNTVIESLLNRETYRSVRDCHWWPTSIQSQFLMSYHILNTKPLCIEEPQPQDKESPTNHRPVLPPDIHLPTLVEMRLRSLGNMCKMTKEKTEIKHVYKGELINKHGGIYSPQIRT